MVFSGSIWSLLSIVSIDLFPWIFHYIYVKKYQQYQQTYGKLLMNDTLINAYDIRGRKSMVEWSEKKASQRM